MRIPGSTQTSQTSSSSSPSSSSSTSSTTSSSSLHSTISTHSLTSSTNSTSSSSSSASPPSSSSPPRCPGLDLLVKAVYHVASGSAVAFPYIQRRVIRRRKPASRFSALIPGCPPEFFADHHRHHHHHHHHCHDEYVDEVNCHSDTNVVLVVGDGDHKVVTNNSKKQQQKRRSKAAPSKYGDSVLQSLKPKRRRSCKV